MQTYNTKLKEKNQLAHNVISAKFSRPENFHFSAGQYVQFFVPKHDTTRSYSICSPPEDDDLEFCVKLYENGVGSEFFKQLNVGDLPKIRGPMGRFTINKTGDKHVFIAAGVGIAPIMSMIKSKLTQEDVSESLKLLFGLRHQQNIFYKHQLQNLSSEFDNFNFEITLSQPKDSWGGKIGRVTDHLKELELGSEFYICGSREMVNDTEDKLLELGATKRNINFEIF